MVNNAEQQGEVHVPRGSNVGAVATQPKKMQKK